MPTKKVPAAIKSLLDIHNEPFILIDENYSICAANKAYADQYHVSGSEIIGKKCHLVSHLSDEPCWKHGENCPLQRTFSQKSKQEVLHVHALNDGSKECVEIIAHPIFGEDGNVQYMGEQVKRLETHDDLINDGLVGSSPPFIEAIKEAKLLGSSDLPALVYGESGVGKERFAAYIHKCSTREDKPFITLDCCGLNETLFESELFGHEPGSFSDTYQQGLFEIADGGTLFLDEIGEISIALQSKLLRVLETGEFRRVGGTETLHADVRLVSATNRDLKDMVLRGTFRNDLYFRLAGHTIWLPPLRTRKEDVRPLTCYFINKLGKKNQVLDSTHQYLEEFNYPGNVRELKYVIELAVLKAGNGQIKPEHLPETLIRHHHPSENFDDYSEINRENRENRAIDSNDRHIRRQADQTILGLDTDTVIKTLQKYNGSRRKAAQDLEIPERKLYRLIKRYKERGIPIPKPYQ